MLIQLEIENFAIIEHVAISFYPKMTVLMGETGAGKSILIDAVSLLLGSRGQKEMIRHGQEKASITGVFSYDEKSELTKILDEYGIPEADGEIIINRQLSSHGRNLLRINGQLTTINVLEEVGQYLVDLHGQSDHQLLLQKAAQLQMLDAFAGKKLTRQLADYQETYQSWKELSNKVTRLKEHSQELAQKVDILEYQLDELQKANLSDPDEDNQLEAEFKDLDNFQQIADNVAFFEQLFDDDENGLQALSAKASDTANQLADDSDRFENFQQMVQEGSTAFSEARQELELIFDEMDFDEDRYKQVVSRLDLLTSLKKKYGPTLSDVIAFQTKVAGELSDLDAGGFDQAKLEKELAKITAELTNKAENLTATRQKAAKELEKRVSAELSDLYMEHAKFEIALTDLADFAKSGLDEVQFLIAANEGSQLEDLAKVASGGEQSRLMLALKAVFATVEPVGTMIFDEIDTGVSGRVSEAIGQKMREIAKTKQVIAITHAPQVAASADQRYLIEKTQADHDTKTSVRALDDTESVEAVARMLAGKELTDSAMKNAAELLAQTKKAR
ncbi:MAG: DNA repair protein RecN [Lactobacillus sp.]|nr:DNA repair protein RecN [Lactobacillus sp.]